MTDRADAPGPGWTVLVTGAGGFVGGHVARTLARLGYRVRGLARRPPRIEPEDPPVEWVTGDITRADDRARALEGARGVVHSAGWVSLARDPKGEAHRVNVEATAALLDQAEAAGVGRFVLTSTLWTVAAGTPEAPADEDSAWNLQRIRCPYSESKREAERLVLARNGDALRTSALCPAMVLGPRDVRPTSTWLLLEMARSPTVVLPRGGIPVVDAAVLALAHARALERAEGGRRYVVAGPHLGYRELAALVARVAGRPRRIVTLPDALAGPLATLAGWVDRLGVSKSNQFTAAGAAGGFLRLHVSGARADARFGLVHPDPVRSIFEALDDQRRTGRAPWLSLLPPTP